MVGVILLHVKQWLMQQMQEGQPAAGMKMPWCHIDNLCEVQVGCSRGGDPPPPAQPTPQPAPQASTAASHAA